MTDQERLDRALDLLAKGQSPRATRQIIEELVTLCDSQGTLANYLGLRPLLLATAQLCERVHVLELRHVVLRRHVEAVAVTCHSTWVRDELRAALAASKAEP
jgi:plasmid stabilization system protein ParE